MTASLSIKELRNFVTAIDNFSRTDLISSEANTKRRIIEPLLEILGWDTCSNEVVLEYPVKIGSTTKYVDYALMLENKPVVFVEAKAFDGMLSYDDSAQIISYGRIEDVQWVVLTNGRNLKVFDTEKGKNEDECLVIEIDLKESPMRADYMNLLSRESILSGKIERVANSWAKTRNAIINLKQKQQEIAEDFKKALLKVTGTETEKRVEVISKQLVVQAIQLFEKQVQTPPEGIPSITRKELATKSPGEVVLFPCRIEGVEFLKKYNAWGFVTMSRKHVPYFALYVGKPKSSVLYFGEIESITQPLQSKEDLVKIQEKDTKTFEAGKRVIHLKPGTLVKFKDPISLKNKRSAPRGLRYTTLERLIQANNIEEL